MPDGNLVGGGWDSGGWRRGRIRYPAQTTSASLIAPLPDQHAHDDAQMPPRIPMALWRPPLIARLSFPATRPTLFSPPLSLRLSRELEPLSTLGRLGLGARLAYSTDAPVHKHKYARFPGDPYAELPHPDPARPPYAECGKPLPPPRTPRPVLRRRAPGRTPPTARTASERTGMQRVMRHDGTAHPAWVSEPSTTWGIARELLPGGRMRYLLNLSFREQQALRGSSNPHERRRGRLAFAWTLFYFMFIPWVIGQLLFMYVGSKPVMFWAVKSEPGVGFRPFIQYLLRQIWNVRQGSSEGRKKELEELSKHRSEGISRNRHKAELMGRWRKACKRIEARGITPREWQYVTGLNLGWKDVILGRFEKELDKAAALPPPSSDANSSWTETLMRLWRKDPPQPAPQDQPQAAASAPSPAS